MDGGLRALGGVLYTETGLINVDLGPLLNMNSFFPPVGSVALHRSRPGLGDELWLRVLVKAKHPSAARHVS